jgi:hypothetical protein
MLVHPVNERGQMWEIPVLYPCSHIWPPQMWRQPETTLSAAKWGTRAGTFEIGPPTDSMAKQKAADHMTCSFFLPYRC